MSLDMSDPWDALERTLGLFFERGGTLSGWGTSDGHLLLQDGVSIVAEIEGGQHHPDTNVLKYWPWLEERPETRLILIHVFGQGSVARRGNRSRLAAWIGGRMEVAMPGRFRYCRLDLDFPELHEQLEMTRTALAALGHDAPNRR